MLVNIPFFHYCISFRRPRTGDCNGDLKAARKDILKKKKARLEELLINIDKEVLEKRELLERERNNVLSSLNKIKKIESDIELYNKL